MTFSDAVQHSCAMLVGSPRSGTTWLAKIVDSHPAVIYRHEPDSVNVRNDIPFVPEKHDASRHIAVCQDYLASLLEERSSKSAGSQPMFPKDYRGRVGESVRRLIILSLKGGERIFGKSRINTELQIPDFLNDKVREEPLFFIKSVSSLCRTYMFSLADPQMKFVHIIRHPCAYVASTIRGNRLGFLNDDAYIETLAIMPEGEPYGLTLDKLRSMSREEQLAARWMLQNEKVIGEMQNSGRYKQIIYEHLCNEPQRVADELFEFLGLSKNEQTSKFIAESSSGKKEEVSYFDVKRDSAAAATGWMRELSTRQIESISGVVSGSVVGKLYFAQ